MLDAGLRRAVIVLPLALALAAPAHAGNQSSFLLGNLAAMTGGAVAVIGDDGASLFYNPAGLVAVDRDALDLSGTAYAIRLRAYPGLLRGDMPDRPDHEDPVLDLGSNEVFIVPSAVAYVRRLSSCVSIGVGLFVPMHDAFSASSELAVRDPTLSLDGAVALRAESTVYTASIGIGWRALPTLRVGVSLGQFYQTLDVEQTLLYGYDAPTGIGAFRGNGSVVQEEDVERIGLNLSAGAQWQIHPKWALGLVVRTPIIEIHESLERRRFDLVAEVRDDGQGAVLTSFAPLRRSGFSTTVHVNFSTVLGLAWTPEDRAFLALELEVQPGSKDGDRVRELLWNVRLGGALPVSDDVELGLGLFTDRSWEPRPEEAWTDRVHYYGVASGVRFSSTLGLAAGEKADSLVFTTVVGLRYALGVGETLRAVADPSGVHTDPTMTRIDLLFHELSLHVGSGLHF